MIALFSSVMLDLSSSSASSVLDSREFKFFLRIDRKESYRAYWGLVKELAEEVGIKIAERHRPFYERQRDVCYLDTSGFDLSKRGYLLRKRVRHDLGKPLPDYELTLKFRSPDLSAAMQADVNAHSGLVVRSAKLEEDLSFLAEPQLGGRRTSALHTSHARGVRDVFSRDNSLWLDFPLKNRLRDYAEIFPVLSQLGLAPRSELAVVNGVVIDEHVVSPGTLDPGKGSVGEVEISAWYEQASRTPLLAEFSCHRVVKHHEHRAHVFQNFFDQLRRHTSKWLARSATTKTAFIYNWKKP